MLIGYARVSTDQQKIDLQIDALKKAGCEKIFEDQGISGMKADRPGLKACLESLQKGDVLVVWRLDRLGRSLQHLIELTNSLSTKEVGFKSLSDAIDTSTAVGKFFFQITGSFAEFERNLIVERTRAGLQAARARGRVGGRRPAISDSKYLAALKLYEDKTLSLNQICENLGIKKRTFYKYMKERAG